MAKNYSTLGYLGLATASGVAAYFNDSIAHGINQVINLPSVAGSSLDDVVLTLSAIALGSFGSKAIDKLRK